MKKRLFYKTILVLGVIGIAIFYAFPLNKRINLGLDLKGGMYLVLKIDTSGLPAEKKKEAAEITQEKIRNRIDELGVREPLIQIQGQDEIVIQLPGITERQRALDLIKKTGFLEFRLVSDDKEKIERAKAGEKIDGYELKQYEGGQLLVEEKAVLTGGGIKEARMDFDQSAFGQAYVSIKFNSRAAKKFAAITSQNVGKRLSIILDGKIRSAPVIRETIPTGEARISGRFSPEEAKDLATVLKIGALPAPIHIEEERTVGPLLGQDSINRGIKAAVVGVLLVFGFMCFYYLYAGLIAVFALLLNLLMILGGLGMLPSLFPGVSATLTLPGIAGIILSLGMAVDANVLINERIKEEFLSIRSLPEAIDRGYKKAFSAILDSNVTTLIAAFLLFQFGTGPIRGFAVTLTIGLLSSMFTAIVVTHLIMDILLKANLLKSLPMLRLIRESNIDFIAKRKIFYALSILLISLGLVTLFLRGKQAYGIDFTGGQIQEYYFTDAVKMQGVRSALLQAGLKGIRIQQFRGNSHVVSMHLPLDAPDVRKILKEKFPGQQIQMLRVERVGPVVGRQLKVKAIKAILWSLAGIMVYVSLRFRHLNFALAGVIALFHDVLIALAFMLFSKRPIDLLSVTAFLTVAGYSINDTIVIYDRVRESTHLFKKKSLYDLINISINRTLARTVLTTLTTLLVVASILIYAGQALNNFAFCLLVGFISGIYSTIYIASPLVLAFSRKSAK
jgi:SecD/SecF fusion protein